MDPFFCVGKKIGGEAEDCVGEGWAWRLEGGKKFNSPLSARGCSPLSPKGKARGLKNKERPFLFAEADSFPVWEAERAV